MTTTIVICSQMSIAVALRVFSACFSLMAFWQRVRWLIFITADIISCKMHHRLELLPKPQAFHSCHIFSWHSSPIFFCVLLTVDSYIEAIYYLCSSVMDQKTECHCNLSKPSFPLFLTKIQIFHLVHFMTTRMQAERWAGQGLLLPYIAHETRTWVR